MTEDDMIFISIHALLAESDLTPARMSSRLEISIHALLAESDPVLLPVSILIDAHFYPRSPCGERHILCVVSVQVGGFLSTLSLRRATAADISARRGASISIHALLAESDGKSQSSGAWISISIHALLAESDGYFCCRV